MTKEQVIAMAREAGAETSDGIHWEFDDFDPLKFATLIRNATAIEERMALADLCDTMGSPNIAEYLRAQAEIILKEPTT